MTNSEYVKSILKGADILWSIAKGQNRLVDIVKDVGLSKTVVHRILKTLVETGLVAQEPFSSKYFLGARILEMMSNWQVLHEGLTICAMEEMQRLRNLTKETVLLHIRVGMERICVEEIESPESIKYRNGKGFVAPLYTGAAGKILLSEMSDDEIAFLLDNMTIVPITERTVRDKTALLSEIRKARRMGYATSFGERASGSACVAVAVKNYHTPVALSVLGPDNRFTRNRIDDLLGQIMESAQIVSNRIAGVMRNRQG